MAIGVISVMVPTDVPIATETKQLTMNKTITANCGGMIESKKKATLSALLLPTTPTKIPATMKISTMVIIFLSPTPFATISSLLSNLSFGF